MELYLVVDRDTGYYDDPDTYTVKGLFTSYQEVANLDLVGYASSDIQVITFTSEQLNKRVDFTLSSYFGSSNDDNIKSYDQFLKYHNVAAQKPEKKEKKPKKKV